MLRIRPLALALLCLALPSVPSAGAQEPPVLPGAPELAGRLGWTFDEALAALGPPARMFPYRGAEAGEDNVVFYYADHSYLFWFRDRVWQVRVDARREGAAAPSLSMGMDREAVRAAWGDPLDPGADAWTYVLPDRGYPVRARLYFDDGVLSDLYVYRSDW